MVFHKKGPFVFFSLYETCANIYRGKIEWCLGFTNLSSTLDPYVIVRLYKGDTMEKQEGEPAWNTRSPHFDETFTFQLVTDFEFPLNVFSLVITIVNRNLIGRDEIIGHMIFSLDSPQQPAVSHWNEVHSNPQEKQTRWHSLVAPDEI